MRTMLLAIVLTAAAAFAGCAENDAGTPTTTTPATVTASTTPVATPTPTPSPSPTPTVATPTPAGALATSVTIVSAPARGAAGANALVCWRVEGTGTVPHVAVHWDAASHAGDNVAFTAYDDGAVYPGNASSAAAAGYALPGDFCGNVPIPASGKVYYRAHVIDSAGAPGKTSAERSTAIAGTATSIAVTSYQQFAQPGTLAPVCWRVEGSGNVGHTAIHYDDETHFQSGAVFSDYDQGARYPDNATALAAAGYDLPATFCTGVPVPTTGEVYLRAHVIDANGAPGIVSEEIDIHRQA